MNLLEGLKIIWSDPEMRKTAIKGVAAVAASEVAGYAVGRALSGKNKHYEGEFPAGTELTILDGNVYHKYPDGRLIPYLLKDDEDYDECEACDAYDAYEEPDDIIYIKGRPYVMDDRGHYVPVRMPSRAKRRRR